MMSKFRAAAYFILAGVVLSAFATELNAQDQKIGFYDSEEILALIPEYEGIQQQLDVLSNQWKEQLRDLETEIKELEEDFEAKEILFTEEIRDERRAEINRKKQEKEQFMAQKFGPNGDYFARQRELLEPIQRQVFTAVRAIARRQNYDFIFDRSGDIYIIYANDEYNLNEDILRELGIDPEEN